MTEVDRIRGVLETHERLGVGVVSVRTVRTLLAEVDRLRNAIARHRDDVTSWNIVNREPAPADKALWGAMGDGR